MPLSITSARIAVIVTVSLFAVGSAFAAQSCNDEVGSAQAQVYVDQCLEVTPATHPPCNAENPCQLIFDEIARSCAMLATDAPEFCSDY